jgi:shikimate kinase
MDGTLWLAGLMGAGKSAVGARLAARLALPFFDTDGEVERDAGASVAEIFAREGEAGFRAREQKAIGALLGERAVVALGGGALTVPGTVERLEAHGRLVYLRARPQTLLGRLGEGRERPLLRGLDPAARLARLRELLAEREADYARAAIVVDVDEAGVEAVVERVLARLATSA